MYFSQSIHHILFNVSYCHIAFILLMPTILIQNGGLQRYEGNVTLKEKTFLITALNSRYVERDVMNKLLKIYVTMTVRK